jgi:hypothetical protein
VIELVISYTRPQGLAERELDSWLTQQTSGLHAIGATVVVGAADPAGPPERGHRVLRVKVPDASATEAEAFIADLLTDMRLIGLQPKLTRAPAARPTSEEPAERRGSCGCSNTRR